MVRPSARKPLPALVFLLGLSLLTALVWWRVLHRSDAHATTASCQPSATATVKVTVVPNPSAVDVEVLNSTQKDGLAASVAQALAPLGFGIAGAANDLTSRAPVTGVAEIRFGPAGRASAALLLYYVPGAVLVQDSRTTAGVDLALGAKFTALATPAQVTKEMAAAHVSEAPAAKAVPKATPIAHGPTTGSTTRRPTAAPSTTPTC